MAIHPTVLYSADRRWRITASPNGDVITVEYDLVFQAKFASLPDVVAWLAQRGINLEDLHSD